MTPDQHLYCARAAYDLALDDVHHAVIAACPGLHHVVQHRDSRPPWCPKCGRTDTGTQIKETP